MKQRRLGWNRRRPFEWEQPFTALHDILHSQSLSRFALVKEGNVAEVWKIQDPAQRNEQDKVRVQFSPITHLSFLNIYCRPALLINAYKLPSSKTPQFNWATLSVRRM